MNESIILTIAVCTYRRFDDLSKWIKIMEKQTLDREKFKVLVIDNSLQPEISEEFRDKLNINYELEYMITEKSGLSYARNIAINRCTTKYLAFIDDDVTVAPDWAEVLIDTFERYQGRAGCVCGIVAPNWLSDKPDWVRDELLYPLALINWGNEEKYLSEDEWLVGAFMGFDMNALRRTKGFSEKLGRRGDILLAHEDLQITLDLRNLGYGIVYNPKLYGEHAIGAEKLNEKWFCKDYFWQTVSIIIFCEGLGIDALDGDLAKELINSLETKLAKHTDKNVKEEVLKDRNEYADLAINILNKYGINTRKRRPDPEYPCIYIVTPCLNAADTIRETLISVCSQTGDFYIRYHVQDGGSTDGTLELLREWKELIDSGEIFANLNRGIVFTYSSEPDDGMYDAITKGFNKLPITKDAAMTWINSDDILMPGVLSLVVESFKIDCVSWVTGHQNVKNERGRCIWTSKHPYPPELIKLGLCDGFHYPHIQQEGTLWRKRLWDMAGGLDINLKYAGDWDLWRRFAQYTELFQLPIPTGCFTQRQGQLSQIDGGRNYEKETNNVVSFENRKNSIKEIINNKKPLTVYGLYWRGKEEDHEMYTYSRNMVISDIETLPLSSQDLFKEYFSGMHIANENITVISDKGKSPVKRFKQYIMQSRIVYKIYKVLPAPAQTICRNIKSNGVKSVYKMIKKELRRQREYLTIKKSKLFFKDYYLLNNPDVEKANINPIKHYIRYGSNEGRNPNPLFNDKWYYNKYNDVKTSGANALAHYIKYGWKENRDPGPQFSTSAYLSANSDVKDAKVCPLKHYIFNGILENRSIRHEEYDLFSDWYKYYSYSKISHWENFKKLDKELYSKEINPNHCDLKRYQDLLTLWFIKKHIPEGARILEVGGGRSRILLHLHKSYECWNIDKLEGIGNGPKDLGQVPYKLVRDYMGTFNNQLPDNYFDFVFSISALEHTPDGDEDFYKNIFNDINRVLKHGGISLHLFDILVKEEQVWTNKFLGKIVDYLKIEPWDYWEKKIKSDNELYFMGEEIYNETWKHIVKKDYKEFGRPASFNFLWVK